MEKCVITHDAGHCEGGDSWCSDDLALEPFLPGKVCGLEVCCVVSHRGG